MRGDVPDRATEGAKLVNGRFGSALTGNRLVRSCVDNGSDLTIEGGVNVAVGSKSVAGRETPDDERSTETSDSNGLVLAG